MAIAKASDKIYRTLFCVYRLKKICLQYNPIDFVLKCFPPERKQICYALKNINI